MFTQVAPVADRIFEVYEDEFREFQREHEARAQAGAAQAEACLLYTSPSPRDRSLARMPSSA